MTLVYTGTFKIKQIKNKLNNLVIVSNKPKQNQMVINHNEMNTTEKLK